jgi:D-alanyl-D-alanine carboxypeptidase
VASGLVPNGRHITIVELLNQTSGIFNYAADAGFEQASNADPRRMWRPRELVRIAVKHPPLFRPGTHWNYSDTNYILLGLVIQAATGKSLGQQLQTRIFTPLHLHATTFPYSSPALPQPYAHGYELSSKGPVDLTATSPSIAWAAGAIVSTAGEVARAGNLTLQQERDTGQAMLSGICGRL